MRNIPACTHIKIMKKQINTENIKITFDSTRELTSIKINFKPETTSGAFPDISGFENYIIIKQISPLEKFTVKDLYSDEELIMLTNLVAYANAIKDLTINGVGTYDAGVLTRGTDSTYTYTLYMPTINSETARELIVCSELIRRQKHSERIKLGIQHKKAKESQIN